MRTAILFSAMFVVSRITWIHVKWYEILALLLFFAWDLYDTGIDLEWLRMNKEQRQEPHDSEKKVDSVST